MYTSPRSSENQSRSPIWRHLWSVQTIFDMCKALISDRASQRGWPSLAPGIGTLRVHFNSDSSKVKLTVWSATRLGSWCQDLSSHFEWHQLIWKDGYGVIDNQRNLEVTIFNSSPLGQNGRHFADVIFRFIFVNEKLCILIKISLEFIPKGPINNNPALV